MILTELKVHHVRNVITAQIKLNPRFNFIIGPNGSGKTSVLEALYLLGCGHSFRSREILPIVSHGQSTLTVFAHAQDEQSISIQKSSSDPTQIKLNNQFCYTTSQLAYALPSQIIYSDLFQIIDAGASIRRSLLDWGLFHVKHSYLSLWKDYSKVLKQRNALLKGNAPYSQFIPWDIQLSQLANQLHELRQEYFNLWQQSFNAVLPILTNSPCSIEYFKGWDKKNTGKDLQELLAQGFESDKHKTYTQQGAHQADIIIESNESKAKHNLSRGQQKIILIALKLAQTKLLEKECLFLIDDLAAELDEAHQKQLIGYLASQKGQYVITSTQELPLKNTIADGESTLFVIDNGNINLM